MDSSCNTTDAIETTAADPSDPIDAASQGGRRSPCAQQPPPPSPSPRLDHDHENDHDHDGGHEGDRLPQKQEQEQDQTAHPPGAKRLQKLLQRVKHLSIGASSPSYESHESAPAKQKNSALLNGRERASARSTTLTVPAPVETAASKMDRRRLGRNTEDLFLEVAQDQRTNNEPSLREKARSRAEKRLSMPAGGLHALPVQRPSTSGNDSSRRGPQDSAHLSRLQQHLDETNNSIPPSPSVASFSTATEDAAGAFAPSRHAWTHRSPRQADQSALSPSRFRNRVSSPTRSNVGGRRTSFGGGLTSTVAHNGPKSHTQLQHAVSTESPAEDLSLRQSTEDSDSADSPNAAESVWDELDDLKSRIKKLELTGKISTIPAAPVSGGSSMERPRTATTAPTTIDSSPKDGKNKLDQREKGTSEPAQTTSAEPAELHPLLHSALAKAKPLLHPSLYRSLETTATDALQLAAMTGAGGPQGAVYSAAAVVNASSASNRQIKRKADSMCRNLTDLCLALCDGKWDQQATAAAANVLDRPIRNLAPGRTSRASLEPSSSAERPISRLDARRSSLGLQPLGFAGFKVRGRDDDTSASEQESVAGSQYLRSSRLPSRAGSRLLSARPRQYDHQGGDDDRTLRPFSRAMTEAGTLRGKAAQPRPPYEPPSQEPSPSVHAQIRSRRSNVEGYDSGRLPSRVTSLTHEASRRRFLERSTPPVMEEGSMEVEYAQPQRQQYQQQQQQQQHQQPLQSRRRISSYAQQGGRRFGEYVPLRAMSLQQERDVLVE